MVKVKSKKINEKSWKTVKIDGPVISDDGNLEGLVGLEILEDYNNSFVKKEKKKVRTPYTLVKYLISFAKSSTESQRS